MNSSPISSADQSQPAFKLRLLCSYGGHIIPRPHDKSLVYSGGETHIVGIDRRTVGASLSYLTSHLSKVYYNNRSFVLKYLLPDGDLDALISVTNDDDLQIMIEEQDRLAASPNHSRIRLFLFPSETVTDQKAEAWLLDALRSVSITQRGKSVEPSLNSGSRGNSSDTSSDVSSPGSACEAKYCSDLASVPETMVLETSSSIGSNGSSASNPNLGVNDIHTEETGFHSADYKIISPSPGSFDSETSSIASILTHTQSPTYHDPVPQVQSMGTLVFPSSCESGGQETQYWVQSQKDPSTPSCPNLQSDQPRCQQPEIRYISASPHLVSQYPSGPFYPVYYSAISPQQQQQQQNQHPLYLSSVRSTTQVYNVPMQCSLVDASNPNPQSGSSIHHSHATVLSPFTYKEVGAAIIPTELSTKVYLPVAAAGSAPPSHFHMASNQTVQPQVNVSEMASHSHSHSHPVAAAASANVCDNNDEDDLLYTTTMYKTQPSAQLVQQYYTLNHGAMGSRQTNADYSQHKIANLQR